ncbi:MAG TPA: hypothetical protein VGS22_25470 [Thermoanaerobaculia bacterium]|jgi:hypothetical protein|nr:hypothetical protein [Thermoanaerobaculia bacterium]
MAQWEPQIRTNLDDPVYQAQLDGLLSSVPGTLGAGLVNTRFREGAYRVSGGRAAGAAELQATIALTAGLFGGPEAEQDPEYAQALAAVAPIESAYLSFREETVLLSRVGDTQTVLLSTVSASLNQAASLNLRRTVTERIFASGRPEISSVLEATNEALLGLLIDLADGKILDKYERYANISALGVDDHLIEIVRALFVANAPARGVYLHNRDGEPIEIRRAEIVTSTRSFLWARLNFDPEHLMVVAADRRVVPGLLSIMLRSSEVEIVRVWVDGLLSYGIKSTMSPFPNTQTEFLQIVRDLRRLEKNDLLGRLDLGGFANYTVGEGEDMQRCQECIYYLPNGKWCDLPELPVPVEPHWWCRLWKM